MPLDIKFTPLIQQEIASCPIQCTARSTLSPTSTPGYILQFNSETGSLTFSSNDVALIGTSDSFVLTCTSTLSILTEQRTIRKFVEITFVDGSDTSGFTILDNGTILSDGGDDPVEGDDGTTTPSIDCSNDRVYFLQDFTVVDYFIAYNSNFVVLNPTMLQFIPACPVQCTLDENMTGGIVRSTVFNVNPNDGRVSIKSTNIADIGDVQMSLTCESVESTHSASVTTDDFIVSFKQPGNNCYMDILDFTNRIPQNNDYTVRMPAELLELNPGLQQTLPGCPVTCELGQIPSTSQYNNQIVSSFDTTTGAMSIATSDSSHEYTAMSFVITCTSDESVHMEALRTVTDTFTVNFLSAAAGDCATATDKWLMLGMPPLYNQPYIIDGTSAELSITVDFFSLSMYCPAICTLYEGYYQNDFMPSMGVLPVATDPSFRSWNQFTGELIVATDNVSYAG